MSLSLFRQLVHRAVSRPTRASESRLCRPTASVGSAASHHAKDFNASVHAAMRVLPHQHYINSSRSVWLCGCVAACMLACMCACPRACPHVCRTNLHTRVWTLMIPMIRLFECHAGTNSMAWEWRYRCGCDGQHSLSSSQATLLSLRLDNAALRSADAESCKVHWRVGWM